MIKKEQIVKFTTLPKWVKNLPKESQEVFKYCLDKKFKVTGFDNGLVILDVSKVVDKKFGDKYNDIRVEPEYLNNKFIVNEIVSLAEDLEVKLLDLIHQTGVGTLDTCYRRLNIGELNDCINYCHDIIEEDFDCAADVQKDFSGNVLALIPHKLKEFVSHYVSKN